MELIEPYLDKKSFSSQVYEVLKRDIYDQRLLPGEKVNIRHLAEKLNCSIVPVREALSRLHAENLLDFTPYRGYIVTPLLNEASFLNLFIVRELLELKATELAVPKITDSHLDTMRQIIRQGEIAVDNRISYEDFKPFTDADYKLHHLLFEVAGNDFLLQAWETLRVHLHLSRLYHLKGVVYAGQGTRGHWDVFHALEKRDVAASLAALQNHLTGARTRLFPAAKP
ncbi:MAG: GntR family transcriptional regulator [Negativicutes bacterium]|nr:GntR family transcriptional regulator [Negativicutes bacterium]